MNWYALLPLAALLTNLIFAELVYLRFRGQRDPANVSFLFLTIFLSLWCFSYFIMFTAGDAETALRFNPLGIFCGGMTTICMLSFAIFFAETGWLTGRKWPYIILCSIPAVLTMLAVTTRLVNVAAYPTNWGYWLERGPIYTYHSLFVMSTALASVFITLSVVFRKKLRPKRHSAIMYSIAFTFPIIAGITTEVIAPLFGAKIMPLTTTLSTVMALILSREFVRRNFLGFTPVMVAEKVIETMSDMLLVLNKDLRVAFSNRAMSVSSGYDTEDLIGMPVANLVVGVADKVHPDCPPIVGLQTTIKTKDVRSLPINVNGAPMEDDSGHGFGFVISGRDMTIANEIVEKMRSSQAKLLRNTEELQKFNELMSGREAKLKELKAELAKPTDV